MIVFACFIALIVKVHPFWPDVFKGYLPSKALVEPSALYAGVCSILMYSIPINSNIGTKLLGLLVQQSCLMGCIWDRICLP